MSSIPFRWTLVRTAALALAVCAFAHAPANAQGTSGTGYSIGVNGGLAVPLGDLSNATNSGYTIGVTLGMKQPLTPLSFRAEGNFTELPLQGGTSSDKYRIYGFAADGLYNLGQPSENGGLYLTGGLGYYGVRGVFTDVFGGTQQTRIDWNVGLNVGLGYYLPLSGFTVNFEGRYTHIFSNPSQGLLPITVGIVF
jgi:hypothetical protein